MVLVGFRWFQGLGNLGLALKIIKGSYTPISASLRPGFRDFGVLGFWGLEFGV